MPNTRLKSGLEALWCRLVPPRSLGAESNKIQSTLHTFGFSLDWSRLESLEPDD